MRAITFHGLGKPPPGATASEARYCIDADRFRELMDWILEFDDYEITFDDGNRSDFEIATPILQERGLKATFFVLADRLSDPTSLTPDDLRALVDAGMKIGSHGTRHRPWSGLSLTDLDEGDLKMTTDFRCVYATMMKEWMGFDDTKSVLKADFQTLSLFKP